MIRRNAILNNTRHISPRRFYRLPLCATNPHCVPTAFVIMVSHAFIPTYVQDT